MRQQIIDDWKQFFSENKEQILAKVVNIEDLPPDDEWFNDEYDERGNKCTFGITQEELQTSISL